jgi:tripartite-type tricarboxylate transporter receptor subunit TctC
MVKGVTFRAGAAGSRTTSRIQTQFLICIKVSFARMIHSSPKRGHMSPVRPGPARRLRRALLAGCALVVAGGAVAQGYPAKAVKFVMPAAPGSSPDRVSRLLAERLRALWGVAVLVENRPGGTGTVGSEYVMRSDPDGYTALFAFTSVVQAPALLPKVPYDIEKDFAPVSLVAYAPTFAELGYPQVGAALWFGVLVPAATPRPVVERMSADINRVLGDGAVAKSLRDTGIEPAGTTPERYAEVLRADAPKWKQMIRDAGITLE